MANSTTVAPRRDRTFEVGRADDWDVDAGDDMREEKRGMGFGLISVGTSTADESANLNRHMSPKW
ncbi:hypothetical protein CA13_47000 [Planctomycetes bacterium CA13]|uniref:Uncharacterized protein n=1 Tax=Novipirellula herctigrandis TaxID=2527986 RepID=A0A5C5Z7M1_9BACT|nr:hypothetical protein CA13_47000 [Planctomycetes bacterium CA13]